MLLSILRRFFPRLPLVARKRALAIAAVLLAALCPGNLRAAEPAGPAQAGKPTLFLIGDSTVHNPNRGLAGWGDVVADWFDPSRITVVNRARGGRSSRTYYSEGLWTNALAEIRPGDFLLIQFGHNDGGPLDEGRARGSLKGAGDAVQSVTNAASGAVEMVHTYGWYLRQYIVGAKARGATAIVLSPIPRNIWNDGKVLEAADDYGLWAAEAAGREQAPFLDLNRLVARRYNELGPEKVKDFFPGDHTHTNEQGARLNASCVAEGLRELKGCAFSGYLVKEARPFAPATQPQAPAQPESAAADD